MVDKKQGVVMVVLLLAIIGVFSYGIYIGNKLLHPCEICNNKKIGFNYTELNVNLPLVQYRPSPQSCYKYQLNNLTCR